MEDAAVKQTQAATSNQCGAEEQANRRDKTDTTDATITFQTPDRRSD
jgi:hypothetical protein